MNRWIEDDEKEQLSLCHIIYCLLLGCSLALSSLVWNTLSSCWWIGNFSPQFISTNHNVHMDQVWAFHFTRRVVQLWPVYYYSTLYDYDYWLKVQVFTTRSSSLQVLLSSSSSSRLSVRMYALLLTRTCSNNENNDVEWEKRVVLHGHLSRSLKLAGWNCTKLENIKYYITPLNQQNDGTEGQNEMKWILLSFREPSKSIFG